LETSNINRYIIKRLPLFSDKKINFLSGGAQIWVTGRDEILPLIFSWFSVWNGKGDGGSSSSCWQQLIFQIWKFGFGFFGPGEVSELSFPIFGFTICFKKRDIIADSNFYHFSIVIKLNRLTKSQMILKSLIFLLAFD
jgi:hypothetical protein